MGTSVAFFKSSIFKSSIALIPARGGEELQ
jgi:hypothetical protein